MKRRYKTILTIASFCAIVALICYISDQNTLANRVLFSSESEMLSTISKTWTTKNTHPRGMVIQGYSLSNYLYQDSTPSTYSITLVPSRGEIKVSDNSTYTVERVSESNPMICIVQLGNQFTEGMLSSLDVDPTTESYAKDMESAYCAAAKYVLNFNAKANGYSARLSEAGRTGECKKNVYYFTCKITHIASSSTQNGIITVIKNSPNDFKVEGMKYSN